MQTPAAALCTHVCHTDTGSTAWLRLQLGNSQAAFKLQTRIRTILSFNISEGNKERKTRNLLTAALFYHLVYLFQSKSMQNFHYTFKIFCLKPEMLVERCFSYEGMKKLQIIQSHFEMQLKSSSFLVRYIIGIQGDIFNFTAPDSHERKDLDQPQVTTCMESKCS